MSARWWSHMGRWQKQNRAAMLANISEGAYGAGFAADGENGFIDNIGADVVAQVGHSVTAADAKPIPPQQRPNSRRWSGLCDDAVPQPWLPVSLIPPPTKFAPLDMPKKRKAPVLAPPSRVHPIKVDAKRRDAGVAAKDGALNQRQVADRCLGGALGHHRKVDVILEDCPHHIKRPAPPRSERDRTPSRSNSAPVRKKPVRTWRQGPPKWFPFDEFPCRRLLNGCPRVPLENRVPANRRSRPPQGA